jgi:hypothetical protein
MRESFGQTNHHTSQQRTLRSVFAAPTVLEEENSDSGVRSRGALPSQPTSLKKRKRASAETEHSVGLQDGEMTRADEGPPPAKRRASIDDVDEQSDTSVGRTKRKCGTDETETAAGVKNGETLDMSEASRPSKRRALDENRVTDEPHAPTLSISTPSWIFHSVVSLLLGNLSSQMTNTIQNLLFAKPPTPTQMTRPTPCSRKTMLP